jgi:hypothetical protein
MGVQYPVEITLVDTSNGTNERTLILDRCGFIRSFHFISFCIHGWKLTTQYPTEGALLLSLSDVPNIPNVQKKM